MKTFKITLVVLFTVLLHSVSNSQYFSNNNNYIPVEAPSTYDAGKIFFDLSEISTNRLDISIVSNSSSMLYPAVNYGHWNQNNGGTFGTHNNYFYEVTSNEFKGCEFVQLRNNAKKDFIVLRDDKIMVFQNDNNQIQTLVQNIAAGSGINLDKGKFDYEDDYDDVVVTTGSQVKIFKNTYQGTLDATYYGPYSISGQTIKMRQFDDYAFPFEQSNSANRYDLIVANGNYVYVYLNTNNNGINTTAFASVNVQFTVLDIEMADMDGDGFNDLIVVGNYQSKVFKNQSGSGFDSNPIWSINNSSYISTSPKVVVADVDMNGSKDIIITSLLNGFTSLFLNSSGSISSTPAQSFNALESGQSASQIKAVDIHNDGSIALITSFKSGIKIMDATTEDPAPYPSIIKGGYISDGGFYRPSIKIIDDKVRDFQYYAIYKRIPGNANFEYLASTTSQTYTDYTENVYTGRGTPVNGQRLSYHVKTVDASDLSSSASNQVNYWVEGEIPDNSLSGNDLGTVKPEKYYFTNYPNPFNPKTVIYYTIPEASDVEISVYNTIGQVIKEYSFSKQSPAAYRVDFDGSGLSSGIYFYKIRAGNFYAVKRMMLIK
jgi:hypothetical protein